MDPRQLIAHALLHAAIHAATWTLCAVASCGEPSHPYFASYRVSLHQPGSSTGAGGSATGIGPDMLITNQHVAVNVGTVGTAKDNEGRVWQIETKAVNASADLALCQTKGERPLCWVRIAQQEPDYRSPVWAYGFGSGDKPPLAMGSGYIKELGGDGRYVSSLVIQSGDSGSGMFDRNSELVGVNHAVRCEYSQGGMAQGTCITVSLGSVRRFVQHYAEDCPDGMCFPESGGWRQRQEAPPQQQPHRRNLDGGDNWLKPVAPPVDTSKFATKDELAAAEKRVVDLLEGNRAAFAKSLDEQGKGIAQATQEVKVAVGAVNTKTTEIRHEVTKQHESLLAQFRERSNEIDAKVKAAHEAGTNTAKETALHVTATILGEKLSRIDGFSLGRAGAAALGLGGPIGLGVGVAGWLISRRLKRAVRERIIERGSGVAAEPPFRRRIRRRRAA